MMEPRTGRSVWAGVELGIASAAKVQVGHRYRLPVNVYGFSTKAHSLDAQDGFERALNAAIPVLAGADELSGIREMEAGVMGSYAQVAVDNEFAGSITRMRKGIPADTDALAVEEIAALMEGSHNFLRQEHIMKYLKSGEVYMTRLAESGSWESGQKAGKTDLVERAQAEAERILQEQQVPPLDDAQGRELDKLMVAAKKELVK